MEVFTVSLFGHRQVENLNLINERLIKIIKDLLKTKQYVSFLIGRNGEFDEYVASLIKSVQKETGKENNDLSLVIPYTVSDLEYYENYYDCIVLPECVHGSHPKAAIT